MENNDKIDEKIRKAREVNVNARKSGKPTRGGRNVVEMGERYERDVAHILSDAFTREFSRRVRKYKGDHDLETPHDFPFVIEVKAMEKIDIYSAIGGISRKKANKTGNKQEVKTQLMKWWEQAVAQCLRINNKRRIKKYPLLIWKQKGKTWLVSAPIPFMREFGLFAILEHYGFGVMTLRRFCEIPYSEIINYMED